VSPVGTLNGETPVFYKVTQLKKTSEKFLWVEENDPRGENLGSWIMNQAGTDASNFAGSSWIDSPAAFHGRTSNFTWADGHASSRKWLDQATIDYATSMNQNKYGSSPSAASIKDDAPWAARGFATLINP
jgi:prepilin-type processing-associated H-X9-DG protein